MKVRELMKRLTDDGWRVERVRGSHWMLKHATKPGLVVVPGNWNDDLATGTLRNIMREAQLEDRP